MPTSAPGLGSLPASCLLGASRAARHAQPQRRSHRCGRSALCSATASSSSQSARIARVALYSLRARYSRGSCRCAHSRYWRRAPAPALPRAFQASRALPTPTAVATAPCAETASSARWLSPGADVGKCGTGEPSPGADVAWMRSAALSSCGACGTRTRHAHGTSAPGLGSPCATSAPRLGTPVPHLHRDWERVPPALVQHRTHSLLTTFTGTQ